MRTYHIEKRLEAVEQKRKTTGKIFNYFPSRADSTAYFLTNGTEIEEPVNGPLIIKLHWSDKPPSSDSFKFRWLKQYQPEQIDEFRREWMASTYERDKIALQELDRLMDAAGEGAREPPILTAGPNPAS
jgi:hypothetical protein